MQTPTKAEKCRNLRYKRPALQSMGYEDMVHELADICEACNDIAWIEDNADLLNALVGDEDEMWEFKITFADMDSKAEQLYSLVTDNVISEEYDDCITALIGNRYNVLGFDGYEEDYFSLTDFEQNLATTEAGKRLQRHTKAEMISIVGQCLGTLIAFLDLRQSYDYLKATIDILRDENTSVLQTIKEIAATYDKAAEEEFRDWCESTRHLNELLNILPERMWVE